MCLLHTGWGLSVEDSKVWEELTRWVGIIHRCLHSHVKVLGSCWASVSMSSSDVSRWSLHWLLQHGKLGVAGHLTCGSGLQEQVQKLRGFEITKCHLCSTRMVEVVRIPYPDSRGGNADVTSQWQTVEEFAAMFENHHKELTVIHLFIQPTSISQA